MIGYRMDTIELKRRTVWWGSNGMLFPWFHVKSLFPEISFLAFKCAPVIPDDTFFWYFARYV
jgi:hypothetical protein